MPAPQYTRWLLTFIIANTVSRGQDEVVPPEFLLKLLELIFRQGITQGKYTPFLRVWQPREGECWAWIYKLWTQNPFTEALGFLDLSFGPSFGDAPIVGPSQAVRGVTDGKHGKQIPCLTFLVAGVSVLYYDYGLLGGYWEVFQSSKALLPVRSGSVGQPGFWWLAR